MSFRFTLLEAGHIITETRVVYPGPGDALELIEAYIQVRRAHPKARVLRFEQIRR